MAWESLRALERIWGEAPRPPWVSADHRDRETHRAALWADWQHPYIPGERSGDRAGIRARARGRLRRAVLLAMFPEDLLVDGHLPERTARG